MNSVFAHRLCCGVGTPANGHGRTCGDVVLCLIATASNRKTRAQGEDLP